MTESRRAPTHRRVLLGHLVSIAAIAAIAFGVALVAEALATREFGVFLFGAGVTVGCLGLSHSHSLRCATATLDPASKPGRDLHILPWVLVAGVAAAVYFGWTTVPGSPLARSAVVVAAVAIVWSVLRGGRAVRRIGTIRT